MILLQSHNSFPLCDLSIVPYTRPGWCCPHNCLCGGPWKESVSLVKSSPLTKASQHEMTGPRTRVMVTHACWGPAPSMSSTTLWFLLPVWTPYFWPHSFLVYRTTNYWPDLYLIPLFPRLILWSGLFCTSCEELYLMTVGDHWRWLMTTQK